ncbi:MAG: hypothetical protein WDW38_005838 [Sanguina aurantia]
MPPGSGTPSSARAPPSMPMTTTPGGTALWASDSAHGSQDHDPMGQHSMTSFSLRKSGGDGKGGSGGGSGGPGQQMTGEKAKPASGSDRVGLVAHQHKVAGMKVQIKALNEQLARNKDNKGLRTQIEANLARAHTYLGELTAQEDRATKALTQKEAHKKWAKF